MGYWWAFNAALMQGLHVKPLVRIDHQTFLKLVVYRCRSVTSKLHDYLFANMLCCSWNKILTHFLSLFFLSLQSHQHAARKKRGWQAISVKPWKNKWRDRGRGGSDRVLIKWTTQTGRLSERRSEDFGLKGFNLQGRGVDLKEEEDDSVRKDAAVSK